MSRTLGYIISACLILALGAEAVEAQTRPTRAIGYSAAERSRVDTLLAQTQRERDALADRVGLSRRLMRSVAEEVGLANPRFDERQFFDAVAAMAQRAERLEADNVRMARELGRVGDPVLRDQASALLENAEKALGEGRLYDAEILYGRLSNLRWEQSSAAQEAFAAAVEAEARTAELRQDFDRARDLRLDASQRELDRADESLNRAFELASAAARGKASEGEVFGRRAATDNAIEILRDRVLPIVPRARYPQLWAAAQTDLGEVLGLQGNRTDGAEGNLMLEQAEAALRAALGVFTPTGEPSDWAKAKHNLGVVLLDRNDRSTGQEAAGQLQAARANFEEALTVRTREAMPSDWATTTNNLANVFVQQAGRVNAPERVNLLQSAADLYAAVLDVRRRETMPLEWASTTSNLAMARSALARNSQGPDTARHLDEAVASYRAAISVYTREARPVDWAQLQTNIADLLFSQGFLAQDEERVRLFDEAIETFGAALTVYGRDELPVAWANVKNAIGDVQRQKAFSVPLEEGRQLLADSIATLREALTVQTYEELPLDWMRTQGNLARSLHDLGLNTPGPEGLALLKEAEEAYHWEGLESITDYPVNFSQATFSMGRVQYDIAERSELVDRWTYLVFAEVSFRAARQIYEEQDQPVDTTWADASSNLGLVLRERSRRRGEHEKPRMYEESAAAYRAALSFYTEQRNQDERARLHLALGLTLMAHGEISEERDRVRLLSEAIAAFRVAERFYTRTNSQSDLVKVNLNIGASEELLGGGQSGANKAEHWRLARRRYAAALEIAEQQGWNDIAADIQLLLTILGAKLEE